MRYQDFCHDLRVSFCQTFMAVRENCTMNRLNSSWHFIVIGHHQSFLQHRLNIGLDWIK